MSKERNRLILANGQVYLSLIQKQDRGGPSRPPRPYEEAREIIKSGIVRTLEALDILPSHKRFEEEVVVCLRLHPDKTAKSYNPATVLNMLPELHALGSRTYSENIDNVKATPRILKKKSENITNVQGRLVFVQSKKDGFNRFLRLLDTAPSVMDKNVLQELCFIENLDLLKPSEQIIGFTKEWREGRVEIVVHPISSEGNEEATFIAKLFKACDIDYSTTSIKQYQNGPTFISCRANKEIINKLEGSNPLRSIHPLEYGGLEDLRALPAFASPRETSATSRSTIKVGFFDGGINIDHPCLKGHVEQDEELSIRTPEEELGIAHGTAVAGVLLYGSLNHLKDTDSLPEPQVTAVSIRALPTSDPYDIDLYESIDVIERAVAVRNDIKVYNISFGPRGPILEDSLSRFTYALDLLAYQHKVTFYVAVGNDGAALKTDMRRIQAPADLINGLGIGSFTYDKESRVHADYSCHGPGRECGKNKPDLTAFGGCVRNPIHLLSHKPGQRVLAFGTSFSSPNAARLGALATEKYDRGSALMGRTLMVHNATHPTNKPDNFLGHGCVSEDFNDIIYCEDSTVTIAYQSSISPKDKIKLPIPLPNGMHEGKWSIKWTIAGLMPIDAKNPCDYTSCCIEDAFYPNSNLYNFSRKASNGKISKKRMDINKQKEECIKLINEGFQRSEYPVTDSEGNVYKTEEERRVNCKWESIVRRERAITANAVNDPFLILHAIGRNILPTSVDYVVLVTISARNYKGDLYSDIRSKYGALMPIRMKSVAETRIRISGKT